MFKLFILTTLIALAAAVEDDVNAKSTLESSDVRADGFDWAVETSNHIHQVASGDEHGNIHGGFGWLAPGGETIKIEYVADEHGYQPVGDLLPTPHPIPEYILKAIEYINAHPSKEADHH